MDIFRKNYFNKKIFRKKSVYGYVYGYRVRVHGYKNLYTLQP